MKCPNCGSEVSENNVFCLNCGTKLQYEPGAMPQTEVPGFAAEPAPHRDPFGPSGTETIASEPAFVPPVAAPEEAPRPAFFDDDLAPIVKTKSWLGTLLLWGLFPLVLVAIGVLFLALLKGETYATIIGGVFLFLGCIAPLIFCFVLAFNKRFNPSKRNFFKAYLLLLLICIGIGIVLGIVLSVLMVNYGQTVDLSQIPNLNDFIDLLP